MTSKKRHAILSRDLRVRAGSEEIQNFLRALRSYPTHFANHPQTSFQQHLFNISTGQNAREPRSRRG
jgi:hypothetical protein